MGPPPGDSRPGPVTQAERDFNRLSTEYYWGSVWEPPRPYAGGAVDLHAGLPYGAGAGGAAAESYRGGAAHRAYAGGKSLRC